MKMLKISLLLLVSWLFLSPVCWAGSITLTTEEFQQLKNQVQTAYDNSKIISMNSDERIKSMMILSANLNDLQTNFEQLTLQHRQLSTNYKKTESDLSKINDSYKALWTYSKKLEKEKNQNRLLNYLLGAGFAYMSFQAAK